jgi:hypothetical protein
MSKVEQKAASRKHCDGCKKNQQARKVVLIQQKKRKMFL